MQESETFTEQIGLGRGTGGQAVMSQSCYQLEAAASSLTPRLSCERYGKQWVVLNRKPDAILFTH